MAAEPPPSRDEEIGSLEGERLHCSPCGVTLLSIMRKSSKCSPPKARETKEQPRPKSLGKWLVENAPRGTELEIPERRERGREIPFVRVRKEPR